MKNVIQLVLAFFGYAKIPVSVVQLSMHLETAWKSCLVQAPTPENKTLCIKALEGQGNLTEFLRVSRKLTVR